MWPTPKCRRCPPERTREREIDTHLAQPLKPSGQREKTPFPEWLVPEGNTRRPGRQYRVVVDRWAMPRTVAAVIGMTSSSPSRPA